MSQYVTEYGEPSEPVKRMASLWTLAALVYYIAPRVPTPTHLRIVVAMSDFEAYREHGGPITGTIWRKGREFAYPDGMTEREWAAWTRSVWRQHRPWWENALADGIAGIALVAAFLRR